MRRILALVLLAVMMLAGLAEMAGCKSSKASRPAATKTLKKAKPKATRPAPAKEAEEQEIKIDPETVPEDQDAPERDLE
jgi:hypothetical protein